MKKVKQRNWKPDRKGGGGGGGGRGIGSSRILSPGPTVGGQQVVFVSWFRSPVPKLTWTGDYSTVQQRGPRLGLHTVDSRIAARAVWHGESVVVCVCVCVEGGGGRGEEISISPKT